MSPYSWRQVRTTAAKELVRAAKGEPWVPALVEAGDLVDAMRAGWGEAPALSSGAGPGWVHWPSFACWAAEYGAMDATRRLEVRRAIARGELTPEQIGMAAGERCRQATIEDPEYVAGPGPLPEAVLKPLLGVVGGVLVGGATAWLAIYLTARRRRASRAPSG